ncbi:hypothetical protein E1B28_007099 [Marasmius oreades]|uniref:Uncharacterized protein n=1 Tax=Marasmius oreades TaxID=181124 RepID=A0A9P7S150_9AGAR|nr:uncharacterized protein E1B28_007099 [Marasmius oreades]KAG7093417.1 hypothetical protein E1B28_007099 [Marasmius oreades]
MLYANELQANGCDLQNWYFTSNLLSEADPTWQAFYEDALNPDSPLTGPFTFPSTGGSKYQPRACYDDMHRRMWEQTMVFWNHVVICGQPGIDMYASLLRSQPTSNYYTLCRENSFFMVPDAGGFAPQQHATDCLCSRGTRFHLLQPEGFLRLANQRDEISFRSETCETCEVAGICGLR